MFGLDNISANNGWSMAIVGISIVFSGLMVLSFAIAQIHKFLHIWENKRSYYKRFSGHFRKNGKKKALSALSGDLKDAVLQYHMLSKTLGEPFPLPKLLDTAVNRGLARPHFTINQLLHANMLIPDGEGFFEWSQNAYDNIINARRARGK